MKAEDFKENQLVICSKKFCSVHGDKILNTSTITSIRGSAAPGFDGWHSFKNVLDACQKYPNYFKISEQVVNNYEIY